MSDINIRSLLRQAREVKQSEYKIKEKDKAGVLRAGMSGIMSDTGDIAGKCHRLSHLRTLGIQDTPDEQKQMMFELGFASEDITFDLLTKVLPPDQVILREEEIPIEWRTSNNTLVTGRPDGVIVRIKEATLLTSIASLLVKGTALVTGLFGSNLSAVTVENILRRLTGPIVAALYRDKVELLVSMELKSVHSMWTARNVLFGGRELKTGETSPPAPQLDNIIQAGHYMWKLNVPYKIIYKAYSQLGQSAGDWAKRVTNLPPPGHPLSQYIDYDKYGNYKGMKQFELVYDLRIDNKGRIEFRQEPEPEQPETEWTKTIIPVADIERYFEFTSKMGTDKVLGPRPMTIKADGSKQGYSQCEFCPMESVCDKYEDKGYDTWLDAVKLQTEQNKK